MYKCLLCGLTLAVRIVSDIDLEIILQYSQGRGKDVEEYTHSRKGAHVACGEPNFMALYKNLFEQPASITHVAISACLQCTNGIIWLLLYRGMDMGFGDQHVDCNSTFARDSHSPRRMSKRRLALPPSSNNKKRHCILNKVWLAIYEGIGQCDWPALFES